MRLVLDVDVEGTGGAKDQEWLVVEHLLGLSVAGLLNFRVVAVGKHRCALPESIGEALNSGDGVYRP